MRSRRLTLTRPLRGFPLPVGEGRPLPPRGEGGRASGRMRVCGAIRSEFIKRQQIADDGSRWTKGETNA